MLPCEREPGVAGKLPEEGPPRSPVALAERMQGVDLAQVVGQPPDECVAVQAPQAVSSCSSRKITAAEDSMYCGRQNAVPLAMATVRICPAQEPQGPARRRRASRLGTPVPVWFPPELLEQARRAADADDRSLSAWIRRAVEHELRRTA